MRNPSAPAACLFFLSFLIAIEGVPALADEFSGDNSELRHLTLPSEPAAPRRRLSLGINYMGAQARWNFSPRWAVEGRYQQGKASSNYGDVKAQVFGLRGTFMPHPGNRFPFYWGSELAYTTAKPETSVYKTTGFAAGAFGGMRCRVTRRISLDLDLGPYVIALTETHTRTSSTNLDFILNTAFVVAVL